MGIFRILLAISVIAAHNGPIFGSSLIGGQMAVESFFIISGFYMALILNEKYYKTKNPFSMFISNRFLRIFPLYWTVLFLSIIFSLYLFSIHLNGMLHNYIVYIPNTGISSILFLVISQLIIFGQGVALFLGVNLNTHMLYFTSYFLNTNLPLFTFMFIPQAWSLELELTFYLIAPFLVKKSYKAISIFLILSFILRIILYNYGLNHEPWTYRFFPTELFFFLSGAISYKFYRRFNNYLNSKVFLVMIGFLLLVTVFYQYIPGFYMKWFELKQWIYYLGVAILTPSMFLITKSNKLINRIGELSYPVYISHLLVTDFLISFHFQQLLYIKHFFSLITVISSIIFSFMLLKVIADPIEKYRQGRLKRAPVVIKDAEEYHPL